MPCSFAVSISETIVANRKRPPQLRQPYLSLPAVVDGRLGAIPTHVAAGFFIRPLPRHSALPPPDLPNFQLPVPRLAKRAPSLGSAQLKCQGTNRPSPALNPGSVELRRVLAKPRVLHPQFANKCFGGIHGCHRVRGFPARFDAGNGACGLGAADATRSLHPPTS